ncbi:MAG TPA: SpoIIE family protein phosphatase [Candidatus Eremiobacteraceae bacterium]|jgi:sigma-B regulation protein RsbU (phosphoserine phosphatase)|nr:SpoIIE family protein phosphatase [Candidatus Eremiobacteraceae bacterium]
MPDTVPNLAETVLEVVSPDGARRYVRVTQMPFLIGRGAETGNHLQLADRRISRNCAAIVMEGNKYYIEDRGQRRGLFINGEKSESRELQDGDSITFGLDDSYEIIYRSATNASTDSLPHLLTRIEHITSSEPTGGGLRKLNLLLEATTLLHSQLPLDTVLGHMLDHAVSVTDADRGLLLETDATETLKVRLARRSGGLRLPPESLTPSQTAIQLALRRQSAVITEDLAQADMDLQAAQSIVAQRLRAVVVIPLYAVSRANTDQSMINIKRGDFLGVLYLDSRRPAAFSKLDRQILDALAGDAASILDNARLVERERERQRMEQEIGIARDIQQALLPKNFRDYPHLAVSGVNFPCLAVGGDYFDVFPLGDNRTAFLLADVSGKGLGAALCTNLLQGALSAMSLGTDPARVFNHVNRFLCDHAEIGRYATMFFGILDDQGHLEYINAGHPSPFLIRNGVAEDVFTEGSYPVGLVPEAEYTTVCLKLEPGDTLVLFSDGVTEAMDPAEQLFGVPRLKDVLMGVATQTPLDELQTKVLDAVENFARGASQADDLTLLLVRYRGAHVVTDTDVPPIQTSSASAA